MRIYSPLKGKIKPLEMVNDVVFSQKMMGDGIAIMPEEGMLCAPMDGEITMVFPTGHAIGMTTYEGVELLMHIGIDTVTLNGKGFTMLAREGQKVKKEDPLISFDLGMITNAELESDVLLIVTKNETKKQLWKTTKEDVAMGDNILELR